MAVVSPLSTFINVYRQQMISDTVHANIPLLCTFTVCSIESVAISAVTLKASNGVVTFSIHTLTVICTSLTLIKVYGNQEDKDGCMILIRFPYQSR